MLRLRLCLVLVKTTANTLMSAVCSMSDMIEDDQNAHAG